jgi:hypothetical protein
MPLKQSICVINRTVASNNFKVMCNAGVNNRLKALATFKHVYPLP